MSRSIWLLLLFFLFGCSTKPDVLAKKKHQDDVLALSYPGNWKLQTEETDIEGIKLRTVTVEPSDGVMQAMVYTPAVPVDLEEFTVDFLKGMSEELGQYQVGGMELLSKVDGSKKPVKRIISGAEREGLELKFVMTALGQKVPMTAEIYTITRDNASAIVFLQTADEDLPRDRPGFDLVYNSFQLR